MKHVKQSHISFKRGQTLKFSSHGASVSLECSSGSVWITAARDPEDYIVTAGSSIELRGKDEIVIQALTDRLELDIKLCA